MTTSCEPVEVLPVVAALPAANPRRMHLDGCARCRARLAAYRSFMAAEQQAGSDTGDAERRLGDALRREIGGGGTSKVVPFRWPLRRIVAGTVALAAVLLMTVVVPRLTSVGDHPDAGPVLRGETAVEDLAVHAAVTADGVWTLSWDAVAGADDYQVILFAADLREISRHRTAGATTWSRDIAEALLWRVEALRAGDPLVASRTHAFDDVR